MGAGADLETGVHDSQAGSQIKGQTGSYFGPEVLFGDIAIDVS
jgi:hypothetical protein